jgi:cation:H+ antiporter
VEALFGSLTAATVVVIGAAAVIVLAGPRMVGLADRLADVTGLGEALVGAVLVGAATSLPDTVATITPATRGLPDLAVGSALGGVLAQAAFLAVADITYRRANLEHAAASLANIMQGTLLVLLLGTVMILFQAPQVTVAGVHPGTLVLLVMYG